MVKKTMENHFKAATQNKDHTPKNFSTKKKKSHTETSLNRIKKTKPLYLRINNFIESAGLFYDHNNSFLMDLKERLLTMGQLDWERHHGSQKQELMEIYRTEEIDVNQEFKMDLEHSLQEATLYCKTEVLAVLKKELLKHF